MSLKTISSQTIATVICLFSLDATFAQMPASEQVPGAAARLKREYLEIRAEFFDDDAARAPIIVQWTGELDSVMAKEHPLPAHGIIDDQETLKQLWRNWRLGVVPKVDFDTYVILAATGGSSLARFEVLSKLKKSGDLQYQFVAVDLVKTGGPSSFISVVPREHVKAFNGQPISSAVLER